MTKLVVLISLRKMPRGAKFPFIADLTNRHGGKIGRSKGDTWAQCAQNALKLADRRHYEVSNRAELEVKIGEPKHELVPTSDQLSALRRFRDANGRYWKRVLSRAWEDSYYQVATHQDAQLLQSVRNQFGPAWLYATKLLPADGPEDHWWGLAPNTAQVAMWGARAIYKGFTIELVHNRMSRRGDVAALCKWLDSTALPWLRKELTARQLPGNSKEILQYREGAYVLRASPNASYGYLYLGAWSK